ncbi:c-type cytochrome [Silvanigrella paludirubra]|uniref:C-type cytochrome n=1 Tax=Silvanigrella paludirubra TaxID=2499159 RepID=A0A6N6VW56_9BACT|nr:cytochrome c [Silvanigrella paludirubra]KAB8037647.1 c-type cytochrome [Silvanigrella paludirubra]
MRVGIIIIFSFFMNLNANADKNDQILSQGKTVYNDKCLSCHGSTGKGDGPVGENLSKKLQPLKKSSEKQIIDVLNAGKKDMMPDYRSSLSSEQKQAVAKYIMEALDKK